MSDSSRRQKALIWFRRDLRIQDHAGLNWVLKNGYRALALFCWPNDLSVIQQRFLEESLLDLRRGLSLWRIPLVIVKGAASEQIPRWARTVGCHQVIATSEFNFRDESEQNLVARSLQNSELKLFCQRTLIDLEDLPFGITELPLIFTEFRKRVENSWRVRPLVEAVEAAEAGLDSGTALDSVLLSQPIDYTRDPRGFYFTGGQTAGLQRLHEFLWQSRSIDTYKQTRNGMLNLNDSSKLSPWLARGCLSARQIYWEIKRYEQVHGANESTYWMIFELLWRDYFKFLARRFGADFFSRDGLSARSRSWKKDATVFKKWSDGNLGEGFIDANMRELCTTGWMSNRGRQNVASYLAKTLGIDWIDGAEWFARHLIDEDPENNYGNWLYVAGVGTDPRDRVFNVETQARVYDGDLRYRQRWLA